MPLLDRLLDVLPGAQANSVQQLVNELLEQEGAQNIRALRRQLQSKVQESPRDITFIRQIVRPLQKISSAVWNDAQQRAYLDLVTMYLQVSALDKQVREQSVIGEGEFLKARAAIHKIAQQLRIYQFLRENPEYQDVRFLNFIDGRNESGRRVRCKIDSGTQTLELPARRRDRHQQENFGVKRTRVTTNNVGGGVTGGLIKDFAPTNMLDGDPSSFWAELVLADGVVLQSYEASWGTVEIQGVVGEVKLSLSQSQRLNNIRLLPFGQYPVKVVDLAFKASEKDKHWQTVPGFSQTEFIDGWVEFDFAPTQMAEVRISIAQVNYNRNIYHLPRRVVANQAFWEQVLDSSFDRTIHDVSLDTYEKGRIEADSKRLGGINAEFLVNEELQATVLQEGRTKQFELSRKILDRQAKVLTETDPSQKNEVVEPVKGSKEQIDPELVEVQKYEYIYGLREVELNQVVYTPFAYYQSPQMNPGATILSVEMDAQESHVGFHDAHGNYSRSSIEYEVQIADNKRFPILPSNYSDREVPDEYIFVDRRTRTGWTRFPIDGVGSLVRKNGVRLRFDEYTFVGDSTKDGRGKLVVTDAAFDPNAVYTITYTAASSATSLDVDAQNSVPLADPDIFEKTDRNNGVELSYYPYIEQEIVNGSQWTQDDEDDAAWRFVPASADITSGSTGATVAVTNGSKNVVATGSAFSGLDSSKTNVFRVKGDTRLYKIASFTATTLVLEDAYEGSTDTLLGWEAGEGVEIDGVLYGLNINSYEPIRVFINDQKAFNLTNYVTLQHQAFTPIQSSGRKFQFIQAGRRIYFNSSIPDAKIEVFYAWKTQYIQVNAIMRSNIPVLTEVTPKVSEITLKLKNTEL